MSTTEAPPQPSVQVRVFADLEAAGDDAAALVLESVAGALAAGRTACVVLSGGRTPRGSLAALARGIADARVPVQRLLWLFADERWVPASHPRSNEGLARDALLAPIGAPAQTIATWGAGDGDPVQCAARYGAWTARARAAGAGSPDAVMLGLGPDGHTASLFPGTEAHLPGGIRAAVGPDLPGDTAAVHLPAGKEWRLTLCPGFLGSARRVVFLISGGEKARALRGVLDRDPSFPGSWIRAAQTVFCVTQDAAGPGVGDFRGDARFA
jgi:6-phosphogluconolactonase